MIHQEQQNKSHNGLNYPIYPGLLPSIPFKNIYIVLSDYFMSGTVSGVEDIGLSSPQDGQKHGPH